LTPFCALNVNNSEMLTSFIFATSLAGLQTAPPKPVALAPVTLARVLKKGQKLTYGVTSNMISEERQYGLNTFLPSEQGFEYKFTLDVQQEKADGIVSAIYQRPTFTEVYGETFDRPERRVTADPKMKMLLEITPINEILSMTEIKPPTPKKKGKAKFMTASLNKATAQGDILGQFMGEVYRLVLFVGSLDSALDFNPKFDYDAVNVGDTWKKTVSYTPQRLKNSTKSAVQRLDYVYTYKGLMDVDGKKVQRVTATLKMDTDAGEFVNQMFGMKPSETGLKKLGLKVDASIDFDLDPKTFITLKGTAVSTGSITLELTDLKDQAFQEARLNGKSEIHLISIK
jgi:hypothetical protein